jgi:hypothetical protein
MSIEERPSYVTPTLTWWRLGLERETRYEHLPAFGHFVIGRDIACDLALPEDEFPKTSRKHVELTMHAGDVRLLDVGSTNGTYRNNQKVTDVWVRHGETFRAGELCFTISYPQLRGRPTDEDEPRATHGAPSRLEQLRAAVLALDAEHHGKFGLLPRRESDPLLAERLGLGADQVARHLKALAAQLGVRARGRALTAGIIRKLHGQDETRA